MRTLSQKSSARPDTSLYPGGPLLYAWSLIILQCLHHQYCRTTAVTLPKI